MTEREVIVKIPTGLHAQPAFSFVETANRFKSGIMITCEGHKASAKSVLSILALGAFQGSVVQISAHGEDENLAVEALDRFLTGDT